MKTRLLIAIGCYALFALLAFLTLEGVWRTVVWIVMGGLAVKTWIAHKQQS